MNIPVLMITGLMASSSMASPAVFSTANYSNEINQSAFRFIGGTTGNGHLTVMDNADGYTQYRMDVYKMPFTDKSNLYILRHSVTNVPSYIARQITGDTKYWDNSRLGRGVVSIDFQEVLGRIDIKAFWPLRTNMTATITSSYSSNITLGAAFGQGSKVSIGDGAFLEQSNTTSGSVSLSLSWSKSISSTSEDPMISGQLLPSTKGVAWTYEVRDPDGAGKLSYHLNTFVLFEMEKTPKENAFKYRLHLQTECYWFDANNLWLHERKWKFGDLYQYNVDVHCFL